MSAQATFTYRAGPQRSQGQRVAIWAVIAALHLALLRAVMLMDRTPAEPATREMRMLVSLVDEQQPVQQQEPPREPPPPERQRPVEVTVPVPELPPPPVLVPVPESMVVAPPLPEPPPPPPVASTPVREEAIIPPDYSAAYLNNPGPKYPEAARRRREEGVVYLKVLVSATGEPEQVLVDRTSGFDILDEAAADMVKKRWRFRPATQGSRAVAAWVAVPVSFTLKNR